MSSGDELAETAAGPPTAAPRPPGSVPRTGDTVGRYLVERVLGAGGMGIVFAALDPDLDRRVALKLLRGGGDDVPAEARSRLLREARAMAKLSHPNVITVYEVGTAGAIDFVAMELIDGQSAAEWLQTRRTAEEVLRVFLAAGRGLAAAHRAGLVHRDFKPANVLVGPGGKVVVTDFGLARAFDDPALGLATTMSAPLAPGRVAVALEETMAPGATPPPSAAPATVRTDHGSLSSTLTRTGAMLGTPAYMAPEQYLGGAGPRADQFAFCVAVWEALAGARPFRGQTLDDRKAIDAAVPQGDVPRALRPVLARGLMRDPARRFDDMDALLDALERTRRRPLLYAAGGAALLAGVAVLALALKSTPAPSRPPVVIPAACSTAEAELASAWSPEIAAGVAAHLRDVPNATQIGTRFEGFVAGWRDTWRRTCEQPQSAAFHGRIACLLGARDELAALTTLVRSVPPETLRGQDPAELLDPAVGCFTGRRPSLPPLPDDPAIRVKIAAIHRDATTAEFTARAGKIDDARATAAAALDRARAIEPDYPAVVSVVLLAQGNVEQHAGHYAEAEEKFHAAATAADKIAADGLRARAMMGQLECLVHRTSDRGRIRDLADKVGAAIARAGDDPTHRAAVDLILAGVAADDGDLDDAIARADAARAVFEAAGDARRTVVATSRAASYLWVRNLPGDVERAIALERQALERARTTFGDDHLVTKKQRASLAWMLIIRDPTEAKALFRASVRADRRRPAMPTSVVRGRVVDEAGRPVPGAVVEAAPMIFAAADGETIMADFGMLPPPATITADAAGRFELTVIKDSTLVATAGDRRAPPITAGPGQLELRVRPTGAIALDVTTVPAPATTDPIGARAARKHPLVFGLSYLDVAGFEQLAAIGADGAWTASGLPAGVPLRAMAVARSALGDQMIVPVRIVPVAGAVTRVAVTVDLGGVILDVIVRADRSAQIPAAQVIALPGRPAKLPTAIDGLRELLFAAKRVTAANTTKVDAQTRTDAGAALYRDDDIHVRLSAVAPGPVTLCVLPFAGDLADERFMASLLWADEEDLEVRCTVVEVAPSPVVQAFEVETPPMKRLKKPPPVPPTPPAPPAPPR